MRLSFLSGEKDLGELIDRLYELKHVDAATRAQVVAALRDANPHLRVEGKPLPGRPILAPDVPGVGRAEDADPLAAAAGYLLGEIQGALDRSRGTLDAAVRAGEQEAQETLKRVRLKSFKDEARKAKVPDAQIVALERRAEARVRQAQALVTLQTRALAQLDSDLAGLRTLVATGVARLSSAPIPTTDAEAPAGSGCQGGGQT